MTDIFDKLDKELDGRIYTDSITNILYSTDASMFQVMPKAVCEPLIEDDVLKVIEFSSRNSIPITPRGAGTGLAGESLGEGIILDFSVSMNRVLEFDEERSVVRVEPGVSLSELNNYLRPYGKLFGPDPATGNRCTIGGMVANNSTGAHSLRYGMTREHVKSLKIAMADGSVVKFARYKTDKVDHKIYGKVIPLIKDNGELIKSKTPDTPRNRHGYLLDGVLDDNFVDLSKLICGSEGTLGVILQIELELSDIPKASRLVCLMFEDRNKASEVAAPLLRYNPSAVEIVDEMCLNMARTFEVYNKLFNEKTNSLVLVELDGESLDEIDDRVHLIQKEFVGDLKLAVGAIICDDDETRNTIWSMRKLIAGMISKVPGKYKPVPLIEDVCVKPDQLPEYFREVDKILAKRDVKWLAFGHAGAGTVHIRPLLDLKSKELGDWLPSMCDEVYDLTLEMGGTISGEHGDGYLRAPFMEKQYGELFEVFKDIKKAFDPKYIMNPDKQTGCSDFSRWKDNIRFKESDSFATLLKFKKTPLIDIVEKCNGCGACLAKVKDSDMCPMFRAHGREVASTRAKANIMRALMYGDLSWDDIKQIADVASYCVNCKTCQLDCPSNVSGADLMLEIKAQAAKRLGFPFGVHALLKFEDMLHLGSKFPRITNFFSKLSIVKAILDKTIGIVKDRPTPKLATKRFTDTYIPKKIERPVERVVYFIDTFANLVNTNVARSLVKVLEFNDVEVVMPRQQPSGIVDMNYGNLKKVRKRARYNYKTLMPYIEKGYKIICSEPSAALMLKDEYSMLKGETNSYDLFGSSVMDIMSFLKYMDDNSMLKKVFKRNDLTCVYHKPCHLKILNSETPVLDLLSSIPSLKIRESKQGCCGIAGTFGMRRKGYKDSMKIGDGLFRELLDKDVEVGVTDCSTCRMQMEHGAGTKPVRHPIEILADSYQGLED